MSNSAPHTILMETDGPVAEVINRAGTSSICLVCEHASSFIPERLADLGVVPEHRLSHAAWDIGARDLSMALSEKLNAPFVAARVSRMVYDCNRPPDAPDAIPVRSEIVDIPGNVGLTEADREARAATIYEPFHAAVCDMLDSRATPPVLVTIHSFTPVWYSVPRDLELGLLHDTDDRLARSMLAVAPPDIDTRLNAPYGPADGVTHTLQRHALPRGIRNVMIEVRNDLVATDVGVARFAELLSKMLVSAMAEHAAS